jgi:hypothetical protein
MYVWMQTGDETVGKGYCKELKNIPEEFGDWRGLNPGAGLKEMANTNNYLVNIV